MNKPAQAAHKTLFFILKIWRLNFPQLGWCPSIPLEIECTNGSCLEFLFLFLFLKILEHCIGKSAARLPKKHNEIKIDPINGFLHGENSADMGGNNASIKIRNNPRIAKKN